MAKKVTIKEESEIGADEMLLIVPRTTLSGRTGMVRVKITQDLLWAHVEESPIIAMIKRDVDRAFDLLMRESGEK